MLCKTSMKLPSFALGLISASLLSFATLNPAIAQVKTNLADSRNEEQVTVDVYSLASPAVVTIRLENGAGSGSIINAEGLILTNNHVVRNARNGIVTVVTSNSKQYRGQVISIDRANDLALIRLQTRDRFPSLRLANSNGIQVGRQVFAIGSPFGLSGTLTRGIISRISNNGDIQTDASLNPGNSGGPLLNTRGELIGVNKAILAPEGRGNTGIGFATSAVAAQQFIARSLNNPSGNIAVNPSPSRLGVVVDGESLVIQKVEANSLASNVGLLPGDRLLAINGKVLTGVQELSQVLDQSPKRVVLTIARQQRVGRVLIQF
jgi:serine protease Do